MTRRRKKIDDNLELNFFFDFFFSHDSVRREEPSHTCANIFEQNVVQNLVNAARETRAPFLNSYHSRTCEIIFAIPLGG